MRLLLVLALLFAPLAQAADCVGLVLGGGGARGAAHIGVLKVLERERIPVCRIAGTSMGAVVGGLYAAGYPAAEIGELMLAVDWRDLFLDEPPRIELPLRRKAEDYRFLLGLKLGYRDGAIQLPRGVIQGQKLMLLLRRLTLSTWDVADFDALPIPFRAVGTDIGAGRAVVFGSGDLATAMRASMSVPAAFAPIRVDGKLMVDGGIVDNVPLDVVAAMGADRFIAVDVGEPLLPESALTSPLAVSAQMLTALMKQRTDAVLAALTPDDLLIRPDLGDMSAAEFGRTREAIAAGERAAEAQLPALRRFAVAPERYAAFVAAHRRRAFDAPLVEFLEVVKTRSRTAAEVERRLAGQVGAPLDLSLLEKQVGSAYGAGSYERIGWHLVERDGRRGLEVLPVDKGWGPTYLTFGLELSDDFSGKSDYQLSAEVTLTGLNAAGAESRNHLSIGRVTQVRSEFYQPLGARAQFYAQPYIDYVAAEQPLTVRTRQLAEYRIVRAIGGVELGWNLSNTLGLDVGIFHGRDLAYLEIGDPALFPDISERVGALVLGFTRDTLDSAQFPSRGSRLTLDTEHYRGALGSEGDGDVVRIAYDRALGHGADRWLLGARLSTRYGDPELFQTGTFLGGFTQLSGLAERELFGAHGGLLRAVYYRRLGNLEDLFTVPFYVGGSAEAGDVWDTRSAIGFDHLIYSGSVFAGIETFFGPIFLGYGQASTGEGSWYLTMGSLLRGRRE